MNNISLLTARVEIARRVTDADQRRLVRTFRTGRRSATLVHRSTQL
jgi:hypothetical protein